MNIYNSLLKDVQIKLSKVNKNLSIDNIIIGKSYYTMKNVKNVFSDMNLCIILLEEGYGFSYFQTENKYPVENLIGKSILEVIELELPSYLRVALLDALYCLVKESDKSTRTFLSGTLREKAEKRAQLLINPIPSGKKVLLLGAVTEIIESATKKGIDLIVSDLEEQKIGLQFGDMRVRSITSEKLEDFCDYDYIISTGMIFETESADRIFRFARENNIKLVLYMETGSNFGDSLTKYGADIILSEYFPFYDFFGDTEYKLTIK